MAYTTVDNPELYFQVKTYTGNSGTNAITFDGSENMQPDWVWTKARNYNDDHLLVDVVRGNTKYLKAHLNNDEQTSSIRVTSFNSDGFTLGSSSDINGNTDTYVAWNWKAGTSFSNDASSTGVGTIDSTGSINTTAGFSIISYTGTGSNGTVAHGLGEVPHWILFKSRSDAYSWVSYQKPSGNNSVLALNISDAHDSGVGSSYFNSTDPTSSVFSLGTAANMNGSSKTFIAYCFAEKQGYSKFGKYTGNGNADGTFIYTGFRPAWLMMKRTDSAGEWLIYDNKRDPFNLRDTRLEAQDNFADSTGTTKVFDFLSNGFKCRGSDADINASGGTYIYMAFAESPFVNSNGVPNNAR